MDEIRLALRRLRKRPGATTASIVTLACAIGAAAVTWSIITAVLLRPLPVADPDGLVLVETTYTGVAGVPGGTTSSTSHLYPRYGVVRDSSIFERTAAGGSWPVAIGANGAPAVTTPSYFVTADFFSVIGVPVALGRAFDAADDRPGAPLVAILSERFWTRTFNRDPGIVGRTMTVGTQTATIVGVTPTGFRAEPCGRPAGLPAAAERRRPRQSVFEPVCAARSPVVADGLDHHCRQAEARCQR